MKVKNSLRSLKQRHRDCRVVRRKGRVYVINKRSAGSKRVRGKTLYIGIHEPRRWRGFLILLCCLF